MGWDTKNCFHGGAFFSAIGNDFSDMEKSKTIISADVLDAWFDPSPKVTEALQAYLPWILKTSPPIHAEGLIETISSHRGIPRQSILVNAGSSNLIFCVLSRALPQNASVLVLNPTYGEYKFFLEAVMGCRVVWFSQYKTPAYSFGVDDIINAVKKENVDAVILVNPNNPTGNFFTRGEMEELCKGLPGHVMFWVDEAYIDYVGAVNSVEDLACRRSNVLVCKSMSKVYALSGARCAYLAANKDLVAHLRKQTPPWAVSLPAQIAGVYAMKDYGYYLERYNETKRLKEELLTGLRDILPAKLLPGHINSILCECEPGFHVNQFLDGCRHGGLFLRQVANMGENWGENAFRVSVKDRATNRAMLGIMKNAIQEQGGAL